MLSHQCRHHATSLSFAHCTFAADHAAPRETWPSSAVPIALTVRHGPSSLSIAIPDQEPTKPGAEVPPRRQAGAQWKVPLLSCLEPINQRQGNRASHSHPIPKFKTDANGMSPHPTEVSRASDWPVPGIPRGHGALSNQTLHPSAASRGREERDTI